MKDYRLSDLQKFCYEQRRSKHSCSDCVLNEECMQYFGYSYTPAQWNIQANPLKYLILSVYDGGYKWSVKSSLGDCDQDSADQTYMDPQLVEIVNHIHGDVQTLVYNPSSEFLASVLNNFDLVMICEDGNIEIL